MRLIRWRRLAPVAAVAVAALVLTPGGRAYAAATAGQAELDKLLDFRTPVSATWRTTLAPGLAGLAQLQGTRAVGASIAGSVTGGTVTLPSTGDAKADVVILGQHLVLAAGGTTIRTHGHSIRVIGVTTLGTAGALGKGAGSTGRLVVIADADNRDRQQGGQGYQGSPGWSGDAGMPGMAGISAFSRWWG